MAVALRDVARERVAALVSDLAEYGSELDVCRAIELEAGLLRAEHAMRACMIRDDYELGLAKLGELTPKGQRLARMVKVRAYEHAADGEGRVRIHTVVDLVGLREPVALYFTYICAPNKKCNQSWNILFVISVSYSHGPARKLVVLRVKARQCFPCPDGSDDKRVFISGARLERLGRVIRLGLQSQEVLQLLIAFDHFDEEWDCANIIMDAVEADIDE